ncbi:MAG: hypothetical protein HC945_01465 [Nitrosarchaeum sp.]|nr:hypothetical protein [Nitrosarchaeum sp.]
MDQETREHRVRVYRRPVATQRSGARRGIPNAWNSCLVPVVSTREVFRYDRLWREIIAGMLTEGYEYHGVQVLPNNTVRSYLGLEPIAWRAFEDLPVAGTGETLEVLLEREES